MLHISRTLLKVEGQKCTNLLIINGHFCTARTDVLDFLSFVYFNSPIIEYTTIEESFKAIIQLISKPFSIEIRITQFNYLGFIRVYFISKALFYSIANNETRGWNIKELILMNVWTWNKGKLQKVLLHDKLFEIWRFLIALFDTNNKMQ